MIKLAAFNSQVARRKEREAAAAKKEARNALSKLSLMGPNSITIEEKYKFMVASTDIRKEGSADSAWDD